MTPVNEGEELRADRRRADANEGPAVEPPTRVAFTAKFGPDEDGFPLQIARGDDVDAAESIDFQVIASRRISREDREVLLRAQEEQAAADAATVRPPLQPPSSVTTRQSVGTKRLGDAKSLPKELTWKSDGPVSSTQVYTGI